MKCFQWFARPFSDHLILILGMNIIILWITPFLLLWCVTPSTCPAFALRLARDLQIWCRSFSDLYRPLMIRIVWLFWPVYFTLCVCDGFDETFRAGRCFRYGRFYNIWLALAHVSVLLRGFSLFTSCWFDLSKWRFMLSSPAYSFTMYVSSSSCAWVLYACIRLWKLRAQSLLKSLLSCSKNHSNDSLNKITSVISTATFKRKWRHSLSWEFKNASTRTPKLGSRTFVLLLFSSAVWASTRNLC